MFLNQHQRAFLNAREDSLNLVCSKLGIDLGAPFSVHSGMLRDLDPREAEGRIRDVAQALQTLQYWNSVALHLSVLPRVLSPIWWDLAAGVSPDEIPLTRHEVVGSSGARRAATLAELPWLLESYRDALTLLPQQRLVTVLSLPRTRAELLRPCAATHTESPAAWATFFDRRLRALDRLRDAVEQGRFPQWMFLAFDFGSATTIAGLNSCEAGPYHLLRTLPLDTESVTSGSVVSLVHDPSYGSVDLQHARRTLWTHVARLVRQRLGVTLNVPEDVVHRDWTALNLQSIENVRSLYDELRSTGTRPVEAITSTPAIRLRIAEDGAHLNGKRIETITGQPLSVLCLFGHFQDRREIHLSPRYIVNAATVSKIGVLPKASEYDVKDRVAKVISKLRDKLEHPLRDALGTSAPHRPVDFRWSKQHSGYSMWIDERVSVECSWRPKSLPA